MADKAALDAVSAALGELATSSNAAEPEKTDENADATGNAESVADSTDDSDGAEGGEESGEGSEEGDAGTDGEGSDDEDVGEPGEEEVDANGQKTGRVRDAQGRFAKKEEAVKPEGDPAKKPAAEAPKAGKDPVNDPIPDGLKKETRERMQSLVSIAKETQAQVEKQQVLFDAIANTGANADQFGMMLGYMRAANSDKPEDLQFAYDMLTGELRAVAVKLGKPIPGVDLVAEHKDLQEAVDAGTLSRDLANEMAVHRARKADQTARTAVTQQTTQQAQQERVAGVQALNDLEETLQAVDPLYAQKKAVVLKQLNGQLGKSPPGTWVKTFREAYNKVQIAPPVKSAVQPGNKQQPLRTNKQPTGQGAKQPSSAKEAMDAALAGKFGV